MSGKFPKPAAPDRGDGRAFINSFPHVRTALPPEPLSATPDPPPLPIPEPAPQPRLESPLTLSRRQAKPVKIPMTYKHRETHYKRLKKISQALDVPMGDLIDEALEARFEEWEAELARLS